MTNLASRNRASARCRKAHPERARARNMVQRAITRGDLARPETCERCGISGVLIDASHDDYDRPLDVEWLCRRCHHAKDFPPPEACPQGHEYTPENSYVAPRGDRQCRTCRTLRKREARRAKKAA